MNDAIINIIYAIYMFILIFEIEMREYENFVI
jgi:hypothetical protein